MKKIIFILVFASSILLMGCPKTTMMPKYKIGNSLGETQYPLLGKKTENIITVGEPDFYLNTDAAKALTQDQRDCVRDRVVFNNHCIGMPQDAVSAVLGLPTSIEKSGGTYGNRSMWVYRKPYSTSVTYVFFENYKLVSWSIK